MIRRNTSRCVLQFLALRIPRSRSAILAAVGRIVMWGVLWEVAAVAMEFGHRTRFGMGLVGAVVPLLVIEALITHRSRWRTRVFRTLAFVLPTWLLLVVDDFPPGTCCFCDHSFWARMWRALDSVADGLYLSAVVAVPSIALLAVLWRPSASRSERSAHALTSLIAWLATLLVVVLLGGLTHLLAMQF